jgi:hypothetical protein
LKREIGLWKKLVRPRNLFLRPTLCKISLLTIVRNRTIDLKGIIKIKGRVNFSILKGKRKRLIVSSVAS